MAVDARAAWMPGVARALVVITLAVALGGCGGAARPSNGAAAQTPARIVALATAAAYGAASVHVAGSIVGEGQPISLNMELEAQKGGMGRVTLGDLTVELVNVDRAMYIKAPAAFYASFAGPAAARRLAGRWLRGSNEVGPLAPLRSLTSLRTLLGSTLAAHGVLTRGAITTVGGQQAVGVSDAIAGGTLYVATTGTPYPLEIVKPGPAGGKLVFNRWNQPVSIAVPPDPTDIHQLQSAG